MLIAAKGVDVPTEVANLNSEWSARLQDSVRAAVRAEQDFRWFNVGDSIATGEWGIASTDQHYAAVAARALGDRLGVPAERHVHTAGDDFSDGAVDASGALGPVPGDFFGSAGWLLRPGERLRYVPGSAAVRYTVSASGPVSFSLDEGRSWSVLETSRSEFPSQTGSHSLVLAAAGAEARIGHLEYASSTAAITWYTSGIGGSRVADLHENLSADGGRGYAAYGASDPDLLSIEIGVNNTIHADEVTLERSVADLRAVLGSFRDAGVRNIVLIGANPVRSDFQPGPWGQREAFAVMYQPVAREFGVPVIDVGGRWGGYRAAHSRGFLVDQVHPTALGHHDIAEVIMDLF